MLAPAHEDLINAPYADARERLRAVDLFVRVLAPAHASAGVGQLHVVRAIEQRGGFELVLTYADYVRL
jgi:hypothetical protein